MKIYLLSLFLYFIYILPVISAKVLYKDDIIRSMQNSGHTWFFDGRPFMAAIHYLINFDTKIFNLAPLNQILGISILCYAGYLFVRKYLSDLSVCLKVLCIVSLVISPLFLENLAFNFESLGFCISLSIPLFMCSVSDNLSNLKIAVIAAVSTFSVLCIYQASIGAIIITSFLVLYLEPEKVKLFFTRLCGIFAGTVVYMLTVSKSIATTGYQGYHSQYSFSIELILKNLNIFFKEYKNLFLSDTNSWVMFLFIVVITACMISICYYLFELKSQYKWVCVLPFLSVVFSVLPMCPLNHPVYLPRVFISFNIVVFFYVIILSKLCIRFSLVKYLIILITIWGFSFSAMFGNVLVAQEKYESRVLSYIAYDLGKLNLPEKVNYHLLGKPLICHEAAEAEKKYKLFRNLNNTIIRNDRLYWAGGLSRYINRQIPPKKGIHLEKNNYPLLTVHDLYYILGDKENIIIHIR